MRRASNIDANHRDIVQHLQAIGCSVQSLATAGRGVPDLLVGRRAVNTLIEVKNPKKSPKGRALRDTQVAFHLRWRGQVGVAHTPAEAEAIVNAAEKWATGENA
jgi:Holliday junction resolvase